MEPILTIIVPTYNMEAYLRQNLDSYVSEASNNLLEVLIMDNSSEDNSGAIADEYAAHFPSLFKVIHKENNGYGSSVNLGIRMAKGKYLRIVDADDWISPKALHDLIERLQLCTADLVETDYTTFHMQSGFSRRFHVRPQELTDNILYEGSVFLQIAKKRFPSLHSTTFRVEFLRSQVIWLLENTFYVDEQLMILSFLGAHSIIYFNINLYQYRLGNSFQSTSMENLGAHYLDRQCVIQSYLEMYLRQKGDGTLRNHCSDQIARHSGNHFTTLYLYVMPRKKGRYLAKQWATYLQKIFPQLYFQTRCKRWILLLLNLLHVSPILYDGIKKLLRSEKE